MSHRRPQRDELDADAWYKTGAGEGVKCNPECKIYNGLEVQHYLGHVYPNARKMLESFLFLFEPELDSPLTESPKVTMDQSARHGVEKQER